jgi:hypothetical protein
MALNDNETKRMCEVSAWLRVKFPNQASKLEELENVEPHHVETLEKLIREYTTQSEQADKAKYLLDQQAQEYQQEGVLCRSIKMAPFPMSCWLRANTFMISIIFLFPLPCNDPPAHRLREILSVVEMDLSSDQSIASTSESLGSNSLIREHSASLANVASELGLTIATEGGMMAAWGQLCLEDMKVSRLQVRSVPLSMA